MTVSAAVCAMILVQHCARVSAKLLVDGSKIEATHGESIKLSLPVDESEKVDTLKLLFIAEGTKNIKLIARHCFLPETCNPVDKPGVSLKVEGGNVSLTFHHVNKTRDSGVYEAQIFKRKNVIEIRITLAVNDPPPASSSAGPMSSPEPPESHQLHWLYGLISLVLVIMAVPVVYYIIKRKKTQRLQMGKIGEQNGNYMQQSRYRNMMQLPSN